MELCSLAVHRWSCQMQRHQAVWAFKNIYVLSISSLLFQVSSTTPPPPPLLLYLVGRHLLASTKHLGSYEARSPHRVVGHSYGPPGGHLADPVVCQLQKDVPSLTHPLLTTKRCQGEVPDKHVGRLDVQVDNLTIMKVLESIRNLGRGEGRRRLGDRHCKVQCAYEPRGNVTNDNLGRGEGRRISVHL